MPLENVKTWPEIKENQGLFHNDIHIQALDSGYPVERSTLFVEKAVDNDDALWKNDAELKQARSGFCG